MMPTPSNIDRLLSHLSDDSLAAELVKTYATADPAERAATLRRVVDERHAALKGKLSDASD